MIGNSLVSKEDQKREKDASTESSFGFTGRPRRVDSLKTPTASFADIFPDFGGRLFMTAEESELLK